MKKIHLALGALALTFSTSSMAYNILNITPLGRCGNLVVQIANQTHNTCTLTDTRLNHGNMDSFPPMSIMAGQASQFVIVQSFAGPDITLTYDCGGKKVTFRSQQNICVLKGGLRHQTVVDEDPGIQVRNASWKSSNFDADGASFIFMRPGQIRWVIENK